MGLLWMSCRWRRELVHTGGSVVSRSVRRRPRPAIVVDLNLEGADDAVSYLLALGSAVEVLGPPSAREAIAAESARISGLYAGALIRRG
jgi:hypothetical protein